MPRLSSQEAGAVCRISGLVLINALVFQEVLSQHEGRVKPLQGTLDQPNPISAFGNQWKFILENINYYPIFHIARGILGNLSATADTTAAIVGLVETAQRIVGEVGYERLCASPHAVLDELGAFWSGPRVRADIPARFPAGRA